jgi:hypothetical protein
MVMEAHVLYYVLHYALAAIAAVFAVLAVFALAA